MIQGGEHLVPEVPLLPAGTPEFSPTLTQGEIMSRAFRAWVTQTQDTIKRRATIEVATYFHKVKVLAPVFWEWHATMSLVKSTKILGAAVLEAPRRGALLWWEEEANSFENKITELNSVKHIFKLANLVLSNRELAQCQLKSGVTRWISVETIMRFNRSAAKLMAWLRSNIPDDPRILRQGKDAGLRNLEERANKVQEKYSQRPSLFTHSLRISLWREFNNKRLTSSEKVITKTSTTLLESGCQHRVARPLSQAPWPQNRIRSEGARWITSDGGGSKYTGNLAH